MKTCNADLFKTCFSHQTSWLIMASAVDKLDNLVAQVDSNEQKSEDVDEELNDSPKWKTENLKDYDTFIFDCDGVVWLQKTAIPGAKETLHELVKQKKRVLFLSNNSTKDITMYTDKFKKLFDLDVAPNQIFTSAVATAAYLNVLIPKMRKHLDKITILMIGTQGLYNMLQSEIDAQQHENVEIMWTRKQFPNLREMTISDIVNMKLDPTVGIVIAGFDGQYGYNDISLACRYLNETEHIELVGTNDDVTFPMGPGIVLAGSGSLMASLQAVAPMEMKICGKPHKLLFDLIRQKHPDIEVDKCLMVGDRLNTDIVFGINSGMKTGLVMTGITNEKILKESDTKPTFVMESIRDLTN